MEPPYGSSRSSARLARVVLGLWLLLSVLCSSGQTADAPSDSNYLDAGGVNPGGWVPIAMKKVPSALYMVNGTTFTWTLLERLIAYEGAAEFAGAIREGSDNPEPILPMLNIWNSSLTDRLPEDQYFELTFRSSPERRLDVGILTTHKTMSNVHLLYDKYLMSAGFHIDAQDKLNAHAVEKLSRHHKGIPMFHVEPVSVLPLPEIRVGMLVSMKKNGNLLLFFFVNDTLYPEAFDVTLRRDTKVFPVALTITETTVRAERKNPSAARDRLRSAWRDDITVHNIGSHLDDDATQDELDNLLTLRSAGGAAGAPPRAPKAGCSEARVAVLAQSLALPGRRLLQAEDDKNSTTSDPSFGRVVAEAPAAERYRWRKCNKTQTKFRPTPARNRTNELPDCRTGRNSHLAVGSVRAAPSDSHRYPGGERPVVYATRVNLAADGEKTRVSSLDVLERLMKQGSEKFSIPAEELRLWERQMNYTELPRPPLGYGTAAAESETAKQKAAAQGLDYFENEWIRIGGDDSDDESSGGALDGSDMEWVRMGVDDPSARRLLSAMEGPESQTPGPSSGVARDYRSDDFLRLLPEPQIRERQQIGGPFFQRPNPRTDHGFFFWHREPQQGEAQRPDPSLPDNGMESAAQSAAESAAESATESATEAAA